MGTSMAPMHGVAQCDEAVGTGSTVGAGVGGGGGGRGVGGFGGGFGVGGSVESRTFLQAAEYDHEYEQEYMAAARAYGVPEDELDAYAARNAALAAGYSPSSFLPITPLVFFS